MHHPIVVLSALSMLMAASRAQSVVNFDFSNAPLHASLPVNVTMSGVTAYLSATGQGFSIQDSSAPVAPLGFTNNFIYPNSVFAADLLIGFSQTVTHFSIQYAPDELGCDDSCTMRVTAYRNNVLAGTTTTTCPNPGTYPVWTLACTFAAGFDRVVVHYDSPPPTCQDYGVIFLADNMSITLAPAGVYAPYGAGCAGTLPVSQLSASSLPHIGSVLAVTADNLPIDIAFMVSGWSNTNALFGPLPWNAAAIGMPGCSVHTSADVIESMASGAGIATYQLTIPNNLALVGVSFYQQALVFDPAFGNALPAVLSQPAHLVIGL